MKARIAIVASHPIQYHAQWYRELALSPDLDVEVLYCHRATPQDQARAGFGVAFEWDLPLLDGYPHRFLTNVSRNPGVTDFNGTDSPELRAIIVRERYDAVVVSGWHTKSYWQAIRACWATRTPVMVRSDSHLHDERPLLHRLLKWLPWRYFIGRMDACLAAGTWSRDYFLHYGASPDRVFVVPHCGTQGAQADDAAESRRDQSRGAWGIAPQSTVFLFVGKFIPCKRPLDFIRAVAAASAESSVHGILAGDGSMRAEMQSLAENLRAPVTFTGFVNQRALAQVYDGADVLVLPSESDTWGLVVNEAMAFGRACIISDHVGCGPDLIQPGRTGFTFPVGDVGALADYMRKIATTPGMAARMGGAAHLLIERYSPREAAAALVNAVAAIMNNR